MSNYFLFHLHSSLSLKDSTTAFEDYIKIAKEVGMRGICFSEHGNVYSWIKKKQMAEKAGLKYVFGIECYLTESLVEKKRDNMHTILMAKNLNGVKELLTAVSRSSELDHSYYAPRISFDEFLNFSDNIISTSACLGSPLNKLQEDNVYFDKLCKKYDYYEIQAHDNIDQINYNKKLYNLSKKYNKPLVVGTDTHEINNYKEECRGIIKSAKKMNYEDEDSYDLSFKTYDELIEIFKDQNSLGMDIIKEALENTNKILDSVDEFELDYSHKYPDFYDNSEEHFRDMISRKLEDKFKKGILIDTKELRDRIEYEISVFKKQDMCSFISFTGELTEWCWKNNIPIGDGRGSVNGSQIAYILDITDVDAMKWNTNFSRFCNEDRISLGDIDLDFYGEDRPKVFKWIEDRFGKNKNARIVTFGTMAEKGAIEEICRGLKNKDGFRIYNDSDMERIKKEFDENCYDNGKFMYPTDELVKKYSDLFYYYDGLVGTIIRTGFHPAGIIGSPITLNDNLGLFYDKENDIYISQCNMKEVDSLNYTKYDILGLKNIGILKGVSDLLDERYKKSHEIDWDDQAVWKDMMRSPIGIFQMEAENSFNGLKEYKTNSIDSMSFVNALIRPSCESFRDRAFKKEKNTLPNKELESILGYTLNFLTFQEQIIEFLHLFCGYTMAQADTIRRAIGKKDPETIKRLLPEIQQGYINNRNGVNKERAEEEFEEFYKVIDSASDYGFSRNHSTPYSMIGFRCARDRYYHPAEFIASYLNTANDMDDIEAGTELAKLYGIKINPITLGVSEAKYVVRDGEIYKGMKSVAYINSEIPQEINSLDLNRPGDEVLLDVYENTSIDSRQFKILAKIDYFIRFGGDKKIIKYFEWIKKFKEKKTFLKEEIDDKFKWLLTHNYEYKYIDIEKKRLKNELVTGDMEIIKRFKNTSHVKYKEKIKELKYCKETDKKYINIDHKAILKIIWNKLPNDKYSLIPKIQHELEYLGYLQTELKKGQVILYVKFSGTSKKGNVGMWAKSYRTGTEGWFKFKKGLKMPNNGDVIYVYDMDVKEFKNEDNEVIKNYKIKEYNIIKEG